MCVCEFVSRSFTNKCSNDHHFEITLTLKVYLLICFTPKSVEVFFSSLSISRYLVTILILMYTTSLQTHETTSFRTKNFYFYMNMQHTYTHLCFFRPACARIRQLFGSHESGLNYSYTISLSLGPWYWVNYQKPVQSNNLHKLSCFRFRQERSYHFLAGLHQKHIDTTVYGFDA